MNETIGVKGGKNDRRRTLRITKQAQEKLAAYQKIQHEEELKKLEKKVNFLQMTTLLKTLPIVIIGQVYQTLTENNEQKRQLALKEVIKQLERENSFSEKEKQEIITALTNYDLFSLSDELLGKLGISREAYKRVSEIDLTDFTGGKAQPLDETFTEKPIQQIVSEETKQAIITVVELQEEEKSLTSDKSIATEPVIEDLTSTTDEEKMVAGTDEEKIAAGITALDTFNEQLDKLKNHKIVDEYEHKLKDVRKELRQLIFEYNLIYDESDSLYNSEEAAELLDRLNAFIKKIEELKNALAIPDVDKYDDNYLYTLIQDYMEEFNNQNFVSEIKDSNLYIMISNKLIELDTKRDKLQEKIEERKEVLEIDEKRLEELKENYYDSEKINKDLLNFQATQDQVLDEINKKLAEATTIKERVEVQSRGMARQSRRLMTMLAASMLLPGARSARNIATLTATYLYFMRNVMNPQTVSRRYKVVNTVDYHQDIEKSLSQLDDVNALLKKTSQQLDRTIKEVEKDFAEYINVIPECKELLQNLEKVKDELKEKEYELARIKEEQEKSLEKNNAKVKSLNYEMAV